MTKGKRIDVYSFFGNVAKAEGQSVYVSDIQNCFSGRTLKNITTHLINNPNESIMLVAHLCNK